MSQGITTQTAHFIITQAQVIIITAVATWLLSLQYLCPILFFFMVIEYFLLWKSKRYFSCLFIVLKITTFFLTVPIFIALLFAIYNITASLKFEKVENCFISGQLSTAIADMELYSILYVNFDYEGQTYLGQACSSNKNVTLIANSLTPYQFFKKGDDRLQNFRNIFCDQKEGNKDTSNRRMLGNISCKKRYGYSEVKIASWVCLDKSYNVESFMEKQSCYVNFYNDENLAKENGESRLNQRTLQSFPLVSFSSHPYYPKVDICFLIIFLFYLTMLSFNGIFQYTSNCFLVMFGKDKLKVHSVNNQQDQTNN